MIMMIIKIVNGGNYSLAAKASCSILDGLLGGLWVHLAGEGVDGAQVNRHLAILEGGATGPERGERFRPVFPDFRNLTIPQMCAGGCDRRFAALFHPCLCGQAVTLR